MTVKEILTQLKALGNEKTYAVNLKAGAGKDQFGVKTGINEMMSRQGR